jgi:hypothetical protein
MPKLPESTRRKQAIFNKGSLFYSHCDDDDDVMRLPGAEAMRLF